MPPEFLFYFHASYYYRRFKRGLSHKQGIAPGVKVHRSLVSAVIVVVAAAAAAAAASCVECDLV
jgi:hypothetical protein